jgi:UDPglucose 6-dehydrogenase
MDVCVVGTGDGGLVLGTCLSNLGNSVVCVDVDKEKIVNLKNGIIPIFEPGLKELVDINVREERLFFTTSLEEGVDKSDVIFIAVGTPQGHDGKADLSFVDQVAENIGKCIKSYKVIVNKSTVPVGTADRVRDIIRKNLKKKVEFDVVSNPEFLREGCAIKDFQVPDRTVIGVDSERAKNIMLELYRPVERTGHPVLVTDPRSAELIKYASNAFLATKISFINEVANLCEKVGADIKVVAKGMGLDERIGPRFLQAGVGYGGACFPKDTRALRVMGFEAGYDFRIIAAVDEVNEEQKRSLVPKIKSLVPDLKGKTIAVWGLDFKPKTDDIREAPSLIIIDELQELGANIKAFDPVAEENAKKVTKDVVFCRNPYDTVKGCDCLVVVTEWDEFRNLDKNKIKDLLKSPNVVDGRNVYDPKEMKVLGFNYIGVGRGL